MMRMVISPAASALLRALLLRAAVPRDRILLTECRSTDWQSLTFLGERHEIDLHIPTPDALEICDRLVRGLKDAEFEIPRQVVADIAVVGGPHAQADGSLMLRIEALTIHE